MARRFCTGRGRHAVAQITAGASAVRTEMTDRHASASPLPYHGGQRERPPPRRGQELTAGRSVILQPDLRDSPVLAELLVNNPRDFRDFRAFVEYEPRRLGPPHVLCGSQVSGWPTIVVSLLLFMGVQMTCVGIMGEYVARIFLEAKGRPLDVVKHDLGRGLAAREL
jgi:hypothetical protein